MQHHPEIVVEADGGGIDVSVEAPEHHPADFVEANDDAPPPPPPPRGAGDSSKPDPPSLRGRRPPSTALQALQGMEFVSGGRNAASWSRVQRRFDMFAMDGALHRSQFSECIGMPESKAFGRELFDALARKRNILRESITIYEMKEFWDQLTDTAFNSRLETFFDMIDKNGDGRITEEHLKEIIYMTAADNRLPGIKKRAEECVRLFMEKLDPNNLGYIEVHKLERLLLRAPRRMVRPGLSSRQNLIQMLSQKINSTKERNNLKQCCQCVCYFMEENWKCLLLVALWLSICIGLFTWKFIEYKDHTAYHILGNCICTAKGAAETLKFNMALIFFPVCRHSITWLQHKARLGIIIPFNGNTNFHKVIAIGIAIGIVVHGMTYLTCIFPHLLHATNNVYLYLGHSRPDNYWWFLKWIDGLTGILMAIFVSIAVMFAIYSLSSLHLRVPRSLRRLYWFNTFWNSYYLFVIVYVLLVIHGTFFYQAQKWYNKTTWMYLVAPLGLYVCERLIMVFLSRDNSVQVSRAMIHEGNVLELRVSKPNGFNYQSGQYIFIKCASVSAFEWHPFYISSVPCDDYLSFHIRTLGEWTTNFKSALAEVFPHSSDVKSVLSKADYAHERNQKIPRVLLDGPYDGSAQDYKRYEVVLLIGLGIGVMTYISIIKDILSNLKLLETEGLLDENGSYLHRETSGSKLWDCGGASELSSYKTRKAYCYWITREQVSFNWVKDVLNEVAEADVKGAIELHNYCTSVYAEGDARSVLITSLQSLYRAKHGIDVVSGTRVNSHFSRPNWLETFTRIAFNHRDRHVGVFYCGTPVQAKVIRQLSRDFSRKTTTKFVWHPEEY